jgi:hypothetical protein
MQASSAGSKSQPAEQASTSEHYSHTAKQQQQQQQQHSQIGSYDHLPAELLKQAARTVWRGNDHSSQLQRDLVTFMAERKNVRYPAYPIRWEMFTNLYYKAVHWVSKSKLKMTKDAALQTVLRGGYFKDCGSITGNALHLELDCDKLLRQAGMVRGN